MKRQRFERLWDGWDPEPHPTINWQMFSEYYDRDPDRWENAFTFLKNTDLLTLDPGVYTLDVNRLIILVQEYYTRESAETRFEAHQKFADIQYVAEGTEKIGIADLKYARVVQPYDIKNDIVFLHARDEQVYRASRDNFFIFFPEDAHRPCMIDGACTRVRKIVVKVGLA
ncbi:MAG TPA: YhcH/YjgK/YiaL family protein [Cyclobacteriaceae bacterium]|jgi:YhcH/YjgK/YiaL family protein